MGIFDFFKKKKKFSSDDEYRKQIYLLFLKCKAHNLDLSFDRNGELYTCENSVFFSDLDISKLIKIINDKELTKSEEYTVCSLFDNNIQRYDGKILGERTVDSLTFYLKSFSNIKKLLDYVSLIVKHIFDQQIILIIHFQNII